MRNSSANEPNGRGILRWFRPGAIRHCFKCRRGFGTVEFAVGAPVFLMATAGVIEFGMMMFVTTLIEGGLREAARFGITGYHPPGETRESYILDTIQSNTIGLVDLENADVTYLVYPSFGDIGQPEPYTDVNDNDAYDDGEPYVDINGNGMWDQDMGEAGLGGPGEVVLYTVAVDWKLLTPIVGKLVADDGKIRMKASVAVRNEPWPTAGGGGS